MIDKQIKKHIENMSIYICNIEWPVLPSITPAMYQVESCKKGAEQSVVGSGGVWTCDICGKIMKMKSEINYHERSHYYSTKYMRSSKAVGVLWGIFTLCYTILAIVVFMQVTTLGQ